MQVPIQQCKKSLAVLWGGAFVVFFFLMLYETQAGPLWDQQQAAWGWMFQNLLPTLSLIVAVLGADAAKPDTSTGTVDRFFFRTALGISVIYLVTMMLTFVMSAISFFHTGGDTGWKPLEAMQNSTFYLGPLQGLSAAALGVFFTKEKNVVG
jgi:hypothetical protein